MSEKIVKALVEGGKATAGPPLGPTLAPMGVNISEAVKQINDKTKEFAGMSVPVNVVVDTSTKKFEIKVGTPPISALIKKAVASPKGSKKPNTDKMGDIALDQIIKIALSKKDIMHAKTAQKAVKEAVGSCVSIGILVDGKDPRDVQKEIDAGKHDDKILGKKPLKEYTQQEINARNKPYQEAAAAREKAAAEEKAISKKPAEGEAAAAPAAETAAPAKAEAKKK